MNSPEPDGGHPTGVEPEAAAAAALPRVHRGTALVSKMVTSLFARLSARGTFSAPVNNDLVDKTSNELSVERTRMASHRSLMAADRTLMAWVRTALSMASFGFTIYKILQGFAESGTALGAAAQPRVVALFLIGAGNLSIILGIAQYWSTAKELSLYGDIPIWRPSFVMAVFIAILSVLLFVAVIFKAL
jgi:putative membrane protein